MKKNIIAKEMESETILYDLDKDDVHCLNTTAQFIYKLHVEGKDVSEIEREIRDKFQSDADQDIYGQVQKCLEGLKEKDLIK